MERSPSFSENRGGGLGPDSRRQGDPGRRAPDRAARVSTTSTTEGAPHRVVIVGEVLAASRPSAYSAGTPSTSPSSTGETTTCSSPSFTR